MITIHSQKMDSHSGRLDLIKLTKIMRNRYISGSMHYSRVPSYYWRDRLSKMYYAGLNAVQTYVPWNFHEPFPAGVYNFDGDHDLAGFLKTAQDVGLLVILRAGPYICGEWEMGGFPSWTLRNQPPPTLRSSDPSYLSLVDAWMGKLLPLVKPLLYENGGPIIMVQVENEYGSFYTCDQNYMKHLESTFRQYLGPNVVLFTTDGAGDGYLKCGTIPSLYATVDFGATDNPEGYFAFQRKYEPKGPLVNSEFYTGWLDHWGQPHQTRNGNQIASSLDKILALNASVNMYMFEGGTNFGFWNGANCGGQSYQPQPTSYDYDAPLNERGEMTDKFGLLRSVIKKYLPVPSIPPIESDVSVYGDESGHIYYNQYADLFESLKVLGTKQTTADRPLTFEDMKQDFGFILYTSVDDITLSSSQVTLTIDELHDRANIYWNKQLVGALLRSAGLTKNMSISFNVTSSKGSLAILVENMGRVNYGSYIADKKGILNGVYLNGDEVLHWTTTSLPLNNTNELQFIEVGSTTPPTSAVFYKTSFSIDGSSPNDTYLLTDQWTKGVAIVNDFNLGRYWPVKGPQKTLYVPASVLKKGTNEVVLFEVDSAPNKGSTQFVNKPDLGLSVMQAFEAEDRR